MNSLQNQTHTGVMRPDQVVVTLVTTETTTLASGEADEVASELPLEQAMQQQANTMTDVLIKIMDRPVPMRFFGLNE